jgi:hypothetical protein
MAQVRTIAKSFNAGEVTPELFGQLDKPHGQTGLAICRNFIPLPHGPAANRPGFGFVRAAVHADRRARLLPFVFSRDQSFAMEFGHLYVRFHTQGATLISGGSPYQVATPYDEADLFDLRIVQSNDVVTITHPNYAPRELRRLGVASWSLDVISFGPSLSAPTGVSVTATDGTGATTYTYKVTAVAGTTLDESAASASATCTNDLLTTGHSNTIGWSAVTGAKRYRIYKESNGLFGFIGQAEGTSFVDDNIAADLGYTPPEGYAPFSGAGDYPTACSYFEQRRVFAGTLNAPSSVWATRSGTESNLNYSIPARDDDALSLRMAAREVNAVQHLAPLADLLALTSAAEWRIGSADGGALTPSSRKVRPQSYVGAGPATPIVVGNSILFAAARGGHLRELGFNSDAGGYITGDLSMRAPHLFDAFDVIDLAFVRAPVPIVWAVSSTGNLLGLTYVPEQQVGAWHWHDTDGAFESICAVPEGDEDVLYAVVRREVNGATVRYVERMASRAWVNLEDAFFVDAGTTYAGPQATSITGLTWLEGKTVAILADGAEHPPRVVTGGAVSLDWAASKVHLGLPITADLQTLPAAVDAQAMGQGRAKNVNRAWLRVQRSSGIMAGPEFSRLVEHKQRQAEPYGTPPRLVSDEISVAVLPDWTSGGQICVRQSKPLPLTVVSMSLEIEVGG